MSYSRIVVLAVALALSASAFAAKPKAKAKVNNYPTLDRVQYVLECVQNYPDKVHQATSNRDRTCNRRTASQPSRPADRRDGNRADAAA